MTNTDCILWQSAQNVQLAQQNLDKLYQAFQEIVCSTGDLVIEFAHDDPPQDVFIQSVWNSYFYIKKSDHSDAEIYGTLTLAIQLTSDEGYENEWGNGKRSKVLICYSAMPGEGQGWMFSTQAPNTAGYFEGWVSKSLHWARDDVSDPSWFYALPLDHLTNLTAVRDLIVTPVHEIIRGGKVEEVLMKIKTSLCQPPRA
ncbi:hypothetical protein AB9K29_06885 [Phaeobacter italicus]|uniref:hypothetical protein n=1 Tax=Phaeobacter italicus TaxID=481446 RepID=UPI003513A684